MSPLSVFTGMHTAGFPLSASTQLPTFEAAAQLSLRPGWSGVGLGERAPTTPLRARAKVGAKKLARIKDSDAASWQHALLAASTRALQRLRAQSHPGLRDQLLTRLKLGANADSAGSARCYIVERQRKSSKTAFRIPVAGT